MKQTPEAGAILVVGPSWVGDMVMAQSLFRVLARDRPDAPIDVLAPGWSLPIVARMPEVRRGVALDVGHGEFGLRKRRTIGATLAATGYAQAIVLPRSFKAALVPWFAGIPLRTGYRGEMRFGLLNDIRAFDRSRLDQTVKRFAALGLAPDAPLDALPQPSLRIDPDNQARVAESLGVARDTPTLAMMPGAEYGPAKCWPHAYFAETARAARDSGMQVLILGSAKDAGAGRAIARDSGATDLCGQTSLEDVIDLLGLAEQALSNDSGLMHVAAAVGCHVHAIYGSSSPAFTPPLTDRRDVHTLALACSPCFQRECPLGHLDCLKKLQSGPVIDAIEREKSRSGDKPSAG